MSTRPTSSETGIVVVGADMRRQHAYILADESGRLTPNNMALRVAYLFDKFNATQIVVEANAGGNHVETTLRNAIERTLPIKSIRDRHGKQIRACPVPRYGGRARRRPLRAEPAPYPDTGAESTT